MIKLRHILSLLLPFLAFVLSQCANQQPPTGGPVDKEPPVITQSSPENYNTNFSGNKIRITFDEYVELRNPYGQVVISPPLDEQPNYSISGKTIIINLKGSLRPNTTYTINFGESIEDYSAANKLIDYKYVFSTGSYLDSLSFSGSAYSAENGKAWEKALIMLYEDQDDSVVAKQKPYYFGYTQKDGSFEINNLAPGTYKVFALSDANTNYLYDQPNEFVAFQSTPIYLSDSLTPITKLYLFQSDKSKVEVDEAYNPKPGKVVITTTKPFKTMGLETDLYREGDLAAYSPTKDTLTYWTSNHTQKKTSLFISVNEFFLDTVELEMKHMSQDSLPPLAIANQKLGKKQSIYQPLVLKMSRPITEADLSQLILAKDSLTNPVAANAYLDENDRLRQSIVIEHKWKEGSNYLISIPKASLTDIFGLENPVLGMSFQTNTAADFGNLVVNYKLTYPERAYQLQVYSNAGKLVHTQALPQNNSGSITVSNISAGSYKVQVVEDRNRNGKWDTGSYWDGRQPERIFTFSENAQLKGGWDLDVSIDL